jgi:EsV-1-7 cysteine-rich motif
MCARSIRSSFKSSRVHLLSEASVKAAMLMRHVLQLVLLLIVKMVVCNALLPAPTFSSQFEAHVCSSHSTGAMKRMAIVMAAAPNASEPVCCFTFALARAYCGWTFKQSFVKVCLYLCVVWVRCYMVRVHTGAPDQPMRQPNPKARSRRHCKHPACTINASYGYEDDRKTVRCVTHIEEGMILLTSKQCEKPNCKTRALFGQPDTKVSDA